jgi:hypothetical protein
LLDSLGALFADAVYKVKPAACDKLLEVIERGDLEFLM